MEKVRDVRSQSELSLLRAVQKGRFAYVQEVAPQSQEIITNLRDSLLRNPGDHHATFWLLYLREYNIMCRAIRATSDGKNIETDTHKESIAKWIEDNVKPAVEATKQQNTFDDESGWPRGILEELRGYYSKRERGWDIDMLIELPLKLKTALPKV